MKAFTLLTFLVFSLAQCSSVSSSVYEKTLPSLGGEEVSLETLKTNKFNVFIAFANDCPVCKSAIPTIREILNQYSNVGVVLFYPNNPIDTVVNQFIESMLPIEVIFVKDKNKSLTQRFKAKLTPEVFILDDKEQIVYSGAVDNSVFTNYRKTYSKKKSFVLNALDTLVNKKKPLIVNETKAVGCYIE